MIIAIVVVIIITVLVAFITTLSCWNEIKQDGENEADTEAYPPIQPNTIRKGDMIRREQSRTSILEMANINI